MRLIFSAIVVVVACQSIFSKASRRESFYQSKLAPTTEHKSNKELWSQHHAMNLFASGIYQELPSIIEFLEREGFKGKKEGAVFLEAENRAKFINKLKSFVKKKIASSPMLQQAIAIAKPIAQSFISEALRSSLESLESISSDAVTSAVPPEYYNLICPTLQSLWNVFENKLKVDIPDKMCHVQGTDSFNHAETSNPAKDEFDAANAGSHDSDIDSQNSWHDALEELNM